MAFFDGLAWVLARLGNPPPLVPQHHRPATIFALGDRAFEAAVVERMVLGAHREALLVGIEAGPLRNCPALEHSVELEPEVPVQPRGIVLLDDEAVAFALEPAAARFLRLREVALLVIGLDIERHAPRHSYPLLRARAPSGSFLAAVSLAGAFLAGAFCLP